MDRQIRIFGLVAVILFGLVFLQLNNLQVRQATALATAPGNARPRIAAESMPRGEIKLASGTVLARSELAPPGATYQYKRVYPQASIYADVTGYFSVDYGSDGVEESYNKYLTAPSSSSLSNLLNSKQDQPDNVVLTLSSSLQSVAETALAGRTGAVVALDPSNGAVLAMYSNPTFNPNPLASQDATKAKAAKTAANNNMALVPVAYGQRYAPGSTFKVITSSAVYDHDPALATKSYPVVTRISLPQTTKTLSNYALESCGGMLPELLKVSCDTGFAQVGLDLGADSLAAEANAFGFDKTPPLDLPGPLAQSNFPPASSFNQNLPVLAYSAIGQENVSATPLEMAMVAGAIADGGTIMTPHVMSKVTNGAAVVTSYSAHPWLQATSATTANTVRKLMVGVVNGGTASNIALPGITLAAKTGTAEVGSLNGLTDDWMIAFGPAGTGQTPTIAVAVVVPNQASSATGSSVSGPIVKAVLASALDTTGSGNTGSGNTG